MIDILRLTNPAILDIEEVQKVFEGGMAYSIFGSARMQDIIEDAKRMVQDPTIFVAVGFEDGEAKSCVVGHLPANKKVNPNPQVSVFFNAGTKELRAQTITALVDFFKEHGYIKFWAINGTGHSDAAWAKVFESAGKSGKIASIMEFDIDV
jgi:hypothetical protein